MQLNCKVIKKWQPPPPHFYINPPPFSGLSPFSSKISGTPRSDSIFGRSYPPGGVPTMQCVFQMFYLLIFGPFFPRLSQSNSSGKRLSPNFYMRFCHLSRNDVKASMSQKTLWNFLWGHHNIFEAMRSCNTFLEAIQNCIKQFWA